MRTRFSVLCGVILLFLASCGGSSEDDADKLADRLSAAKSTLDDATTISISLETDDLPSDTTGLVSATGKGNHDPAFTGDVKVRTGGASLSAEVIAVDGKLWAKTSFSPSFLSIEPDTLEAPNPASLLSPDDGISALLTDTEKLHDDGQKRSGSDVVTSITGVLDGTSVKQLIPSADDDKRFDVDYSITDDDELMSARLTGPFYPDAAKMSYTITVSTSSQPVDVSAP